MTLLGLLPTKSANSGEICLKDAKSSSSKRLYQCHCFLCVREGSRCYLLEAREFVAPATLNSTTCNICSTILDIESWAGREEEGEPASVPPHQTSLR